MTKNASMIEKLFFKLLPVQVMIIAMGSINSIVDGAVAGRFIDAATVGVIGLFSSAIGVINALSSVLLGGSAVLCGRYMGRGDIEKTQGVFSLNLTVTSMLGFVMTASGLLFPGVIADICGADEALRGSLVLYVRGFAIGILPMMLVQQLAAFLQMERQSRRNYAGIAAMIVFNVTLDILFVSVMKMGVFGLALSTALCNWIYLIILLPYYLTKKAQLKYDPKSVVWKELPQIVKIGFPGALLVLCLSFRGLVQNRIILRWAGQDGMSAKGSLEMVSGLFIAFCLGGGATVRMLASVFVGEEDRDAIRELIRISLTKLMLLTLVITALVITFSGEVASIFFADRTSVVFRYTKQFFMIFGASIPLILLVQVQTNYLQAGGHHVCVDISSVIDGFFSVVIPSLILTPVLGALGVWLSTPIGIVITSLIYPVYACIYHRHVPRNTDEWLLFRPDFGVPSEDRLVLKIRSIADVTRTSEQVQAFCLSRGFGKRTAYYSALCLEEMAGNVVEHGFIKDRKMHDADARVIIKDGRVLLRIKDDCVPFDPLERSKQMNPSDLSKNIGIRLVVKISDEAVYQNLLGLNVFTIRLNDRSMS
ncbi:MAG: polysaccharide biosynthesis C-terminal domain-containing protein [Lachnospiraceae bacterium]|nr:polysaccharide biosynthesis C-terminal domain-containing protein [Lachnospiraceae bacterium]